MNEFFELLDKIKAEAVKEYKGEEFNWKLDFELHDLAFKYASSRFDKGYEIGSKAVALHKEQL